MLEPNKIEFICPLTKEELKKYSDEHIFYEIKMFFDTVKFLNSENHTNNELQKNVFIESFAIHFRNLYYFLYDVVMKKEEDIVAKYFVKDINKWKNDRSSSNKIEHYQKRTSKEIAHLTIKRIEGATEEKVWPFDELSEELRKILIKFYENIDEDVLGQKVIDQLEELKKTLA